MLRSIQGMRTRTLDNIIVPFPEFNEVRPLFPAISNSKVYFLGFSRLQTSARARKAHFTTKIRANAAHRLADERDLRDCEARAPQLADGCIRAAGHRCECDTKSAAKVLLQEKRARSQRRLGFCSKWTIKIAFSFAHHRIWLVRLCASVAFDCKYKNMPTCS